MPDNLILLISILGSLIGYVILTVIVCSVASNREDNTPLWEPIVLCIFFTPILALLVEALKPYKLIKKEDPKKVYKSTADISDEDLQRYLERKNSGK